MLFTKTGVKRLEKGGLILGLFEHATFEEDDDHASSPATSSWRSATA